MTNEMLAAIMKALGGPEGFAASVKAVIDSPTTPSEVRAHLLLEIGRLQCPPPSLESRSASS